MNSDDHGRDAAARRLPDALAALLTLIFLAALIRTAWISDDASITLRTLLNATHGFGLRFNIAERVQTFTHPLWLAVLALAYKLTANVYFAAFAASLFFSTAAFWLAVTQARSIYQAVLAAAVLLFSRAFVDFATSGLENPLSYALLAAFVTYYIRGEESSAPAAPAASKRWLIGLWLLTALLYLTRPDDVLIVAPLLGLACWRVRRPRTVIGAAVLGVLPAIAWTLFSIVYYGFPFPNTAYAKLGMGIDRWELWTQGSLYLIDSIDRDPLTLTMIGFAIVLAIFHRRPAARALAVGLVLYLVYVVSIGGDFMAGRFLAASVFAAVLLTAWLVTGSRPFWIGATVALLLVGSASAHVPLWSNSAFDDSAGRGTGIIDERGVYFKDRSLVRAKRMTFREPDWPSAGRTQPPLRVLDACGLMGSAGLDFGPYTHLLDECALADPLLARLPAVFNVEWRSGHYRRMIPAGYRETLQGNGNVLQDPGLREFYDRLQTITRSDRLWSLARFRTILQMNLGAYNGLVDRAYYRHGGSITALDQLSALRSSETPANDPGNRILTQPLAVTCPDRRGRRYLEVALDSNDRYVLTFLKANHILSTLELGPIPEHRRKPGLTIYTVDVPPRARTEGFDTIVVAGVAGDDRYALGHLLLEGVSERTDALLHEHVAIRDGFARR